MMRIALAVVFLSLGWVRSAAAHDLTVSLLSVREQGPGEWITRWERVQGVLDPSAAYLLLRPVFPAHCRFEPPRLRCGARGLAGPIGFQGLGEVATTALIQLERAGQAPQTLAFTATAPRLTLRPAQQAAGNLALLRGMIGSGLEHILYGWDHLAFVLGLLWLVQSRVALLETITAFTLGHSLTLAAAALGYTTVPAPPVEAVIALSIAFLALELLPRERAGGSGPRAPWGLALGFGLLHGLGFANALSELELARAELPLALLGFNLGVEIGQLVFVAAVLALGWGARRLGGSALLRLRPGAAYALGSLAMYWFIERIAVFGL